METRNIRIKLSVENTWLNVNLTFKRSKQTAPLRTEANCMECLCGDHRKWPNDPSKPSNHHQWYIMRHAQPLVDAYRDVTSEGGANLTCPGAVPSRSAPPQAGSGHARQTATTCSNVNEMQGSKLAQKNPVRSYSETYAEFSGTSRFFYSDWFPLCLSISFQITFLKTSHLRRSYSSKHNSKTCHWKQILSASMHS